MAAMSRLCQRRCFGFWFDRIVRGDVNMQPGCGVWPVVSIAGCDDTPVAVKIWPRLTRVQHLIAEISELATRRAIELLRARNSVGPDILSEHLPLQIIERESTKAIA